MWAEPFKVWAVLPASVCVACLLTATALATGAEAGEAGCTGQVVLDRARGLRLRGRKRAVRLVEKGQTLDVAWRLEALLEADGHPVCITRTGDETLSNADRYAYANTTGARVLVSVHMNGSTNPGTDCTTTLFGKWQKDKAFAQTVLKSLSALPTAGGAGTIATKTPYSFAPGVLLKSEMPETTIAETAETVFITSEAEGRLLSDGTGTRQQQIAGALKTGVEDYLSIH